MMKTTKMKANKRKLRFDNCVYTTLPGSLALSCYIVTDWKNSDNKKPTWKDISKKTKALMKDPSLLIPFDDPEYIKKTLKYYDMEIPDNFPLALVVGDYNSLFTLYIDGDILPLREDGIFTKTLTHPRNIIPLEF